MKLHWSPRSPYVRKVMICAEELSLEPQLERIRTVTAMLKPNVEFMRENPLSKIPTLVLDDGTLLYDSVVICEYLDRLAGGTLFPREGMAKWQSLRWHALGNGMLDVLILWRNEREREVPLAALREGFELKTRTSIAQLESEADALAAVPLNIGHVALCCALAYADFRFKDLGWRDAAPRLAAWFEGMERRPAFMAHAFREG